MSLNRLKTKVNSIQKIVRLQQDLEGREHSN